MRFIRTMHAKLGLISVTWPPLHTRRRSQKIKSNNSCDLDAKPSDSRQAPDEPMAILGPCRIPPKPVIYVLGIPRGCVKPHVLGLLAGFFICTSSLSSLRQTRSIPTRPANRWPGTLQDPTLSAPLRLSCRKDRGQQRTEQRPMFGARSRLLANHSGQKS